MNGAGEDLAAPGSARQSRTWRRLVLAQAVVIAAIVIGVIAIFVIGLAGSLFTQRPL